MTREETLTKFPVPLLPQNSPDILHMLNECFQRLTPCSALQALLLPKQQESCQESLSLQPPSLFPPWDLSAPSSCVWLVQRHNLMISPTQMPFPFHIKDFTCMDSASVSPNCTYFHFPSPWDASDFTKSAKLLFYSFLHSALFLQNRQHLSHCIINSPPISNSIESTFSPLPVVPKLYTQLISKYQFRNLAR